MVLARTGTGNPLGSSRSPWVLGWLRAPSGGSGGLGEALGGAGHGVCGLDGAGGRWKGSWGGLGQPWGVPAGRGWYEAAIPPIPSHAHPTSAWRPVMLIAAWITAVNGWGHGQWQYGEGGGTGTMRAIWPRWVSWAAVPGDGEGQVQGSAWCPVTSGAVWVAIGGALGRGNVPGTPSRP